jgi:prophage antirepressor-like protein
MTSNAPLFRGRQLRCATIDGILWFSAPDAAKCLGRKRLGGTAKFVSALASEDRRLTKRTEDLPGLFGDTGPATMTAITLNGLLTLAKRTRGPTGKSFSKWLQASLLPYIQATDGQPIPPSLQAPVSTDGQLASTLAKAFRSAARALESGRMDMARTNGLAEALTAALSDVSPPESPKDPEVPNALLRPLQESSAPSPSTHEPTT